MKCFTKKILCYILIGFLSFSVTSTVYYRSVHAMEWVGGALAFEEALKWLLACIGITATAGMTDAYWEEYGDEFTDYAIENGATQTEVAEWQLKACEGVIDKGSVVWENFKEWASALVNGTTVEESFDTPRTIDECVDYLQGKYTFDGNLKSVSGYSTYSNKNVFGFILQKYVTSDNYYTYAYFFDSSGTPYIDNINGVYIKSNGNIYRGMYISGYYNNVWNTQSYIGVNTSITSPDGSRVASSNLRSILSSYNSYLYDDYFVSSLGGISDTNFDSVTSDIDNLDVISSDGVDEDNSEVTIPMPGVSDSDNEVSKDAYDEIIDAINDGTITQEEGLQQIQEILKIITYDTVTDKVVPPQVDPDTGEDKSKDDVLKENKENMGFTLGGLENVFPFCIPFDIYAFMTLLVAEPECPEFDFPIKSVNGEVEEIHVDLEPFEPVAVVVRYCFDFLFIIGLALLTRSLIGGGSSD